MQIADIWLSQRMLRRAGQLPEMVKTLREGGALPKIIVGRAADGSLQLEDGHHRLTAIWLSGRRHLEPHEFLLVEKEQWRPRRGKVADLLSRCRIQPGGETDIIPCF